MIRIKKDGDEYVVTISCETRCAVAELPSCVDFAKDYIGSKLDRLVLNADAFDEVKIDSHGALHCKNIAPEPEQEDKDE